MIPEPIAAAIDCFGYSRTDGRVLLYDLGGGTFDLALLENDEGGKYPYRIVD